MFDFVLKKRIKKLCKDDSRTKSFRHLSEIRTILVIFETCDYDAADAFIEHLEGMGKKVKGCAYRSKDDKYDYSETPYRLITYKEDTDWMGGPWSDLTASLEEGSYDALIDLTIKENLTLEYVVAFLTTPLKIGYKKNDLPLYDLAIAQLPKSTEDSSEVAELGKQILHYLNTIHSKV